MKGELDRVSVSFGMKMPGPVNFSSISFNLSLSSDVKSGETLEEAWDRISTEVDEKASVYYDKYGKLQEEDD